MLLGQQLQWLKVRVYGTVTVQDTLVRSLLLVHTFPSYECFLHPFPWQYDSGSFPCDCRLDCIKCLQNDFPSVQQLASAQIISAAKLLSEHLWQVRSLCGMSSREWDACVPGCEHFPLVWQFSLTKTGSFMTGAPSSTACVLKGCCCWRGGLCAWVHMCAGVR